MRCPVVWTRRRGPLFVVPIPFQVGYLEYSATITMSFGFSVGDFIVAIELANRIRKDFVDAPSQFKATTDVYVSLVRRNFRISAHHQDYIGSEASHMSFKIPTLPFKNGNQIMI
jgi:hypothetical protein